MSAFQWVQVAQMIVMALVSVLMWAAWLGSRGGGAQQAIVESEKKYDKLILRMDHANDELSELASRLQALISAAAGSMKDLERLEQHVTSDGQRLDAMLIDVRDVLSRLRAVEEGQTEWIKTLRQRTHDIDQILNLHSLKIDRLEHRLPGAGDGPAG